MKKLSLALLLVIIMGLLPVQSVSADNGESTVETALKGVSGTTFYKGIDYSSIYDCEYYSTNNPDLLSAYGNNGDLYIKHFASWGISEGRVGKPGYNIAMYETMANLAKGELAAVNTYNKRDYSLVYDYLYYTFYNTDVINVIGYDPNKVLEHFVKFGMAEGRQAKVTFDVKSYSNAYTDLRNAFGGDLKQYYEHYINYGYKEGRIATGVTKLVNPVKTYKGIDLSSVYDYAYYTEKYPDLKVVYGNKNDDSGAIKHFVIYGVQEGRIAIEKSSAADYERLKKISKNIDGAITSYMGVDLSPIYSYEYYAWKYPDVAEVFNYNPASLLEHFINYGLKEGREGKSGVKESTVKEIKDKLNGITEQASKMAAKANEYTSPTGYIIVTDKAAKKVAVYTGSRGNYALKKTFSCVIGANSSPTPNGVYQVGAKGLYFNTGTAGRCWYYTQIRGNYLFHSQIYDRQSRPVRLIDSRMGAAVSHGCIRLYLDDAKWIYDNVPTGSTIVIY